MGGKSKIFDPKQLESIYLESRHFNQKVETSMHIIQSELAKLSDPSSQIGLADGHGHDAKESISNLSDAIGVLKRTLETTNKFIEVRLAGAAQLAQDKHLLAADVGRTQGFPMDLNLKK